MPSSQVLVRLPQTTLKRRQLKDKITIHFQKSEVSNGFEVEDVNIILENDSEIWLTVTLSEPAGVEFVLSRENHELIIDRVAIPLEVKPAPSWRLVSPSVDSDSDQETVMVMKNKEAEAEVEEDEQLIEVTGYKKTTDIETLKLYFENLRRSGGGEIETIERYSKTGGVRITFKDPSVAAKVEGRKHKLAGYKLKVKLVTKKKRRPLPTNARCLFLEGIPDGCSSEHLKLFIENRASMDEEPTIQYGEKPGTALCTFSCDIPDLDKTLTNISKKELKGVVLTAEKVHETDAVLVTGCSQVVSLMEVIDLYFDNKKKSGGSGVRDVQPGPVDGQAIVHFDDWNVVNGVLRKDHKIGGKAVKVETYHECLGKLSHGDQASVSDISDKTSPEQLKRGTGNVASSIEGAEAQETGQKVGTKKPQAGQRVQVPFQGEQGGKAVDTREGFQGSHNESYEQLIEVTGFKPSTDDEIFKLYFENRGKSGGGEIETIERDSKTGAVRITFKDPSVAATVEGRKHKLAGANLNVKLITKKKRRPLPINARCLFLEGIPHGCPYQHLKLFIENRASMDEEPTIQYGEKPGTAICTFSCDIPELDDVITKIPKKKLRGVQITAEKVHESDALRVQGFSQDIDFEMIDLYFDNKTKSGGGGVREVQPGPVDGQAIVHFEDWMVVQDVLARGLHKLGSTELRVDSYYEFLGRLSPLDAPTPHIPKPVSVEVHEPTMEFLYEKGENAKKKLLKDLAEVKANLLWPDGSQKSQAKLKPVEDDSQPQSSWLNWEKEAVDVLTDFMNGYKTASVPIPQTLWEGAADKLQKMTTTCSMVPDAQRHEVILVGEHRDVDVTEATIIDIIKKLQKEADYDAEQVTEDINWDTEKLQLFTLCGIKQEIEKSFPALRITVFSSPGKTGITLGGTRTTVKEVELKIRRMMDSLEKTEFKAGSIKVRFVQSVTDNIHAVLGSRNIRAACSGSDDGRITIHGATSRDIGEAKAYIDHEIDEDVIPIKGSALAVVRGHEGKKLVDCINKQKLVMVEMKQDSIEVAGFKSKLEEAKSQIIKFLKNTTIIKKHIICRAADIQAINRLWHDEVEFVEMENQANYVKIESRTQGSKTGFAIEGNQDGIESARSCCLLLMERLYRNQEDTPKSYEPQTIAVDQLQSDQSTQISYRCPVCGAVCGQPKGNQPKGTMTAHSVAGLRGAGFITITYAIPSGTQTEDHPNPGKPFVGVTRTAYLPNNREGREVLSLLKKAFDAGLVFTVGRSITTGAEDTVTWANIHHKTSRTGGPSNYGYPDAGYLRRVKKDLAAVGIV
ncbi:uncharacterized protein [Asterias amurensis]|uniref:uncharacterized protein isoform X2 n=1 Tax=Asterias amurensis TaxID=7602 RepID=UPI003AB5384C